MVTVIIDAYLCRWILLSEKVASVSGSGLRAGTVSRDREDLTIESNAYLREASDVKSEPSLSFCRY